MAPPFGATSAIGSPALQIFRSDLMSDLLGQRHCTDKDQLQEEMGNIAWIAGTVRAIPTAHQAYETQITIIRYNRLGMFALWRHLGSSPELDLDQRANQRLAVNRLVGGRHQVGGRHHSIDQSAY
jgi:hypothetical protein